MKFIGTFREVLHTDTSIRVTFDISKHYYRTVNELSKERLLEIEVNEKRGQRSLNQNRLLWELIHQIDLSENGRVDKDSEMNLYMNLIKMSKIRIDYFQTLREAKEMLENAYRVVEEKESRISKGVETVVYACYRGSSHFNKEEMTSFIETVLNYASQLGLNIDTYVDELSLKPFRQIHD
jgi:hypothetical protein